MDERRYERSAAFDRLAADIMTLADRLADHSAGGAEALSGGCGIGYAILHGAYSAYA